MSDEPDPEGEGTPGPDGSDGGGTIGDASSGPRAGADPDVVAGDDPGAVLVPPGRSPLVAGLVAAAVVVLLAGIVLSQSGGGSGSPSRPTATVETPETTAGLAPPPGPATTLSGSDTAGTGLPPAPTVTAGPPTTFEVPIEVGELRSVLDLAVGDCWNDPPGFDDDQVPLSEVVVVDCEMPHDNEVFSVFELPGGDYDDEAVPAAARLGCLAGFEPYVERPFEESELDLFALWPRPEAWAFGDHEVVCSAYDIELTPLVGSVRGSGR